MQAVAAEPPRTHGPVGVRPGLQQPARQLEVVELQALWQRVAEVPVRRLGGEQRLQAIAVAMAHRLPHGAALVERGAVGGVGSLRQQQAHELRLPRPADGGAEHGAVAAHRLPLGRPGVGGGSQLQERPGELQSGSADLRVATAVAGAAERQQGRPAALPDGGVDVLRTKLARCRRVGQHQRARDRLRGQPRVPLQDRVGPLIVACQRGGDERGFRAGPGNGRGGALRLAVPGSRL